MRLRHRPEPAAEEPADPAPVSASGAPLTDAYRRIRRVTPPESPLPGVLAAEGERRVLLVDAAVAAGGVFGGHADRPQHLLAPLELVRRSDGHDLELPWCREPLGRLLDARTAQGRPLAGGELVTLVVSLLRGTREAWDGPVPPDGAPAAGRWWVDDEGRPLFAPADDGGQVASEADALIERAMGHTRERVLLRVIGEAREALQRPRRLHRVIDGLEDALFEAFAPRALERGTGQPTVRPVLDEDPLGTDAFRSPPSSGAVRDVVERFTDTAFAEAVGEGVDRARTAVRRALTSGGRRLPLAVGGAAALAVIAGGLLLPTDPDPADARAVSRPTPSASRAATPSDLPEASPAPSPRPTPATAEGAHAAGDRLRLAAVECGAHGDPLCAAIREEGAEPLGPEVLDVMAEAAGVELLDDYGDVAVLRADAVSSGGSALLQLVRLDGRWLLRGAQLTPRP